MEFINGVKPEEVDREMEYAHVVTKLIYDIQCVHIEGEAEGKHKNLSTLRLLVLLARNLKLEKPIKSVLVLLGLEKIAKRMLKGKK